MSAPLRLALLGDSIAYGMGATTPEQRLAARLADGLGRHGVDATVRVVAVPGARSAALSSQVDAAVTRGVDVALIVIGANDLTHQEPLGAATSALGDAVQRLRRAGAEVVVAPAPDLSSVPWVPAALRDVVRTASDRFRQAQVAVAVAQGARVADQDGTTARAFAENPSLFSADRFHPSGAGYAVIAAALLPTVLEACRA
jgi:lysophospholipase L1-like esterase